jgi:Putative restriction endonuclease
MLMSLTQATWRKGERRYLRRPKPVRFPTDFFVPEDKLRFELRTALFQLIQLAFGDRAIVGSDQFVYFDAGDPQRRLAPDVMVWVGAPDELFGAWKVWERGAPHVAVEIVSPSDAGPKPWSKKLEAYRQCGVPELVRFNPRAKRTPPLRIWDRVDGDLVERDVSSASGRHCDALGLYWCIAPDPKLGSMLRLARDAAGRDLLPTLAEAGQNADEARRQEAEARRQEAEARRQEAAQAQARIAELEAELAKRG